MRKLTGMAWLKKHIAKLEFTTSEFQNQIAAIKSIEPEICNEFHPWTPLKLVLLNYALDTCTTIIRNKKQLFKRMYCVDLFAGSGINKLKGTKDFLIGSPFIATFKYGKDYDLFYFCENDAKLCAALKKRLNTVNQSNIQILSEDCMDCLDGILQVTNKPNNYAFFFVDPFFLEFEWSAMKKVLHTQEGKLIGRDILFTFMSGEIMRFVGLAKKGKSEGMKLNNFFGDDSWKNITTIESAVELYKNKILQEIPYTVVRTIKIKSKKHGFCYHLFFITNKTQGNTPWIKAIDRAKQEIEKNSDKSVEMALNIIKKRQAELANFLK